MTKESEIKSFVVNIEGLPVNFPTHPQDATFWEALGRAVATFGFLEEILGKAIFAFTATREISSDQIEAEYAKWLPTLERALDDPLGRLIQSYGSAVRKHQSSPAYVDDLLNDLRESLVWRNVICHGSRGYLMSKDAPCRFTSIEGAVFLKPQSTLQF